MSTRHDSQLSYLISHHRSAAGLSQRELAVAAGISVGVIRDIEQGITSRPRADSLRRLARALGLDLQAPARQAVKVRERQPAGPGTRLRQDLDLQILGPLAVERHGREVVIGPARMRLVLALLAVSPNETVSRKQISEAIWGGTPPRNSATMIQASVSGLRRVLDSTHTARAIDGLIVSSGSGYRLNTQDIRLDLLAFRELTAAGQVSRKEGDLAACSRSLARALELWRGDPLGDVDGLSHHPAVTGLARQHDHIVVEYAEAASQFGWHDGPLRYLERLVDREPLNERAFACYIVALAGTGQHAAALGAFDQMRRRLADDLGLSPGPELRTAQAQVLRQQVRPAALAQQLPGPFPTYQLPAQMADFTGRAAEIARLAQLLRRHRKGDSGGAAVLSGMPGVGKTTLALQAAHIVKSDFPDGQLWVSLSENGRPRDPGTVLAGLLNTFGVPDKTIPRSTGEKASLYRSMLAGRRILIVADEALSASQILPLTPGSGRSAIMVATRSEMASPAGSRLFQLSPFTKAEGVELLRQIIAPERVSAEPRATSALVEICGGLPLAVRIIGMTLAVRKYWQLSALVGRLRHGQILDELVFGEMSVRASFTRSYQNLDDSTQRTFRNLSLLESAELTEPAVEAATGERDAAAAAATLADRSLLLPAGTDATGRPKYRLHMLLRSFAAEQYAARNGATLPTSPKQVGSAPGQLGPQISAQH